VTPSQYRNVLNITTTNDAALHTSQTNSELKKLESKAFSGLPKQLTIYNFNGSAK